MKKPTYYFVLLFVLFLLPTKLLAVNYYWVGGNGAWSQFATHWAKIPNPAVSTDYHANVPTADDDVYFGNTNGGTAYTLNVDASSTVPKCRNMDWTGVPAGTVWGGFGSRIEIYGSTTLDANMSITFNGSVRMTSFEASMKNVTSNTVHFGVETEFVGTAGGWNFVGDFYVNGRVNHEGGLIETNGWKVTIGSTFYGNYYGPAGQLHLGSSEFNIVGYGYFIYSPGQFDAGTSHIKFLGANVGLVGPINFATTIHFYDVSFFEVCTSGGFNWGNIDGTLTFHQFGRIYSHSLGGIPILNNVVFLEDGWIANATNYKNLTFTAGKTYTIENHAFGTGTDQTILPGGTLTALGAGTCSQFITIKSWKYGTAVNFVNNSGTDIMTGCVILEDVHADGPNTMTVNDGLDLGNNTGWIFVNPHSTMDLYWVGGAGDWDDPCHWTTNPAGTVGNCNCTPNGATNVHFTANSGFSSDPLDVERVSTPAGDAYIAFRDMDWSGVTGNPTYFTGANNSEQFIYGSLTYSPNMVLDFRGNSRFRGKDVHTLTSAGQTFKEYVFFEGIGELRFQDAFNYSNGAPNYSDVYHLRGTIKTLGNSITLDVNNGWQGNKDLNNNFVDQGAELWLGEVGGNSSTVSFGGDVAFVAAYEAGKFHAVQSHIKPEGPGTATVTTENRPHDFWNVSFINNFVGIFYGGILNKLTYDGSYGIVANSSPNRLIHEMEMKDDGEINGNQTFDIVTLTGGNGYTLQNGSVQTITSGGALNTTSDCEHYVTLTSGYPDKTSAIKKEGGGALTINNVVLDNITGDLSTGATYTALNGIALGTTTGWSVPNAPARTLYWVGGNGDWNSAAHWSLASGGAGGECPPTPLDNVFFNGASGLDAANVVTISQLYAHCKDMDWTGAGNGTKLTGISKYLNIYGNLTFSAVMDYEVYSTYFRATQPTTITSAGNKYFTTYFWSSTGDWTLMDDFETVQDVDVYHYYGTLRSNNHTIGVGRIWWGATPYYLVPDYTTNPTAKLFLGSSKVKIYPTSVWAALFLISYPANNFAAGTSEIIFESGVYSTLYGSDGTAFYDVTFKEKDARLTGECEILGKALFKKGGSIYSSASATGPKIHYVEFLDDAYFYGSRPYHIMKFAPGKRYTFTRGFTQTIVPHNGVEGQFIAQGLPGQYIEIKSDNPSIPAIIHMDDYNSSSTCTKYLFLTGMTHTGTEDIYVPTPGGNVFNNTGWQFFPCNPCPASIPVLAANSITVGCPPGKAKLILNGLKPDEWAIWYTDPAAITNIVYNGGTTGPSGNLFEPLITAATTYYARVYSDGGLCESTVILSVPISINTAPSGIFDVTGGGTVCSGSNGTLVGLTDSDLGVVYELYRDGISTQQILFGTGNTLTFGLQQVAGTYTVIATPTGTACSLTMTGNAIIVTSTGQAPSIILSSNAPICIDETLQLFETGGQAQFWQWQGPAGFSAAIQSPTVPNVTATNGGTYQLIATGSNGCTSMAMLQVVILDRKIGVRGNNIVILNGDITPSVVDNTDFGNVSISTPITRTFTLHNAGNTNLDINSISLTGANSNTFTVANISLPTTITSGSNKAFNIIFSNNTLGNYTATVNIESNACTAVNSMKNSGQSSMPPPFTHTYAIKASVAEIGNLQNTTICPGSVAVLTAAGGGIYAWSTGANSASITVAPVSTTTYTVTVTNGATITISSATVNVQVPPLLNVVNGQFCLGESIDLSTLVVNSTGFISYFTSAVNAANGTNPLLNSIVSPPSASNFYIRSQETVNTNTCTTVKEVVVFTRAPACGTIQVTQNGN